MWTSEQSLAPHTHPEEVRGEGQTSDPEEEAKDGVIEEKRLCSVPEPEERRGVQTQGGAKTTEHNTFKAFRTLSSTYEETEGFTVLRLAGSKSMNM